MSDLISRKEAQECQRVAQKRRYTFGNDEFSLEAAYHDCKLVFDGITDDDSFQEADTGLILYYANEIIYALQETLEGKGTNALCNDTVSRQAAIDAVEFGITYAKAIDVNTGESKELFKEGNDALRKAVERLKELPSAEPDVIRCKDCKHYHLEAGDDSYALGYCPFIGSHLVMSKGFCAWGERRGEQE